MSPIRLSHDNPLQPIMRCGARWGMCTCDYDLTREEELAILRALREQAEREDAEQGPA